MHIYLIISGCFLSWAASHVTFSRVTSTSYKPPPAHQRAFNYNHDNIKSSNHNSNNNSNNNTHNVHNVHSNDDHRILILVCALGGLFFSFFILKSYFIFITATTIAYDHHHHTRLPRVDTPPPSASARLPR